MIKNYLMLHSKAISIGLKRRINQGANIYAKSANGNKALHAAAFNGHKNVVEFFLNRGLSINYPGGNGFTPLHVAAEAGHLEVAEFLIAKKKQIFMLEMLMEIMLCMWLLQGGIRML